MIKWIYCSDARMVQYSQINQYDKLYFKRQDKKDDHMITSTDEEKAFNEIQYEVLKSFYFEIYSDREKWQHYTKNDLPSLTFPKY